MPRVPVEKLRKSVSDELRKGLIFEAPIFGANNEHIEGLCNWETQNITVNPSVSVVDTLVHELLHRRFPKWSEDRVRMHTWRVMRSLTQQDVQKWYRRYKRHAKKKRVVLTKE